VYLCLRRNGFQQRLLPNNAVNTATNKSVGAAIRSVQLIANLCNAISLTNYSSPGCPCFAPATTNTDAYIQVLYL
jgi:hypothetical protein